MPTNFTVVPVKDNTRKAAEGNEEEDDISELKEEDATGEIRDRIRCTVCIKNYEFRNTEKQAGSQCLLSLQEKSAFFLKVLTDPKANR